MITLENVTREYKMGSETLLALDHLDIKIEDGEFIAIMGPSGSGKSTLANMIGGLDTPSNGKIIIDEQELHDQSDRKLSNFRNREIGFIFQSFNLLPQYTALENVMLPLMFSKISRSERKKRAVEALKSVGLEDRMKFRPNQLSGGQRQRVSIARAIVTEPKIIIADEPTGNLDSKKSKEVITLLKGLQKKFGLTLIIITHDPNVAAAANRTLTIQDGKLKKSR